MKGKSARCEHFPRNDANYKEKSEVSNRMIANLKRIKFILSR